MQNKVSYLVISDIHLGHPNNTTDYIVDNLLTYFKDNHKVFKTLDIIFIAGDIFDRLLSPSSPEYILIIKWLTTIAQYCKYNNIKLRILEGTPSHDNQQAKVLGTILNNLDINMDYKYISTLDIEHMSDLGLDILYVPDEYKSKASDTFKDVEKLLVEHNLTQVDIAIMHGQFNYQLPIKLESSHSEDDYLNIVKYYINIGHIHIPSVNGRILAQGSFDRISHNEEDDKGGLLINLYANNDMEFFFIKNKHARVFKTFTYNHGDIEYIANDIKDKLKSIPKNSFIRIKANREDKLKNITKILADRYPNYIFKIEYNKEDDKHDDIITDIVITESFHITKDNIEELLLTELEQHMLSSKETTIAKDELNRILNSF